MRRPVLVLVLTAVVATAVIGCAGVGDRVDQLRSETQELTDRARFCLAITRAATAIESGSPATAQEAADEVLAQAPEELTAEARAVVDELRRVMDDDADLRDDELRAAAERLRARTLQLCDPR